MACRKDDQGQIILLAGVLLVLGFILFSVQLTVLTNVGAQVGRETANPLLDDYELVRRGLETSLADEVKDPRTTSSSPCPDILEFGYKAKSLLGAMSTEEGNRGQALHWGRLQTSSAVGGFKVLVELQLSDGISSVYEELTYTITCTGAVTVPPACTSNTCIIK